MIKRNTRTAFAARFGFSVLSALAIALTCVAGEVDQESDALPPIKDHTLFVGLKCRITQDGKAYTIRDVVKTNVVLQSDDSVTTVSINDLEGLDVRPETLIAPARLKIDAIRHERAYSVLANPEIEAQRAQQAMAEAASVRMDIAMTEATGGTGQLLNQEALRGTESEQTLINYLNNLAAAEEAFAIASNDYLTSPVRDISTFQDMETEQDQHDVLLIEFEASASETIPDAYAISLTEYTTPDKPKEPAIAMHFSDLPWIGTKPRHYTIRQINFPFGFKVNEVQVHIFSRGREIASNLSEKAMDVSSDEALQFLQMAHANTHKQQDVPPALVRELIPPSLILAQDIDIAGQSVILELDENGTPKELPETLTDGRPIDPGLKSLLGKVYFYPALEKGMPVSSKIEFFLEQIFQ